MAELALKLFDRIHDAADASPLDKSVLSNLFSLLEKSASEHHPGLAAKTTRAIDKVYRVASDDLKSFIENQLVSSQASRYLLHTTLASPEKTFAILQKELIARDDPLTQMNAVQSMRELIQSEKAFHALAPLFPFVFDLIKSKPELDSFFMDALADIVIQIPPNTGLTGWDALIPSLSNHSFYLIGALLANGTLIVPETLKKDMVEEAFVKNNLSAVHGCSLAVNQLYPLIIQCTNGMLYSNIKSYLSSPFPEIQSAWYYLCQRMVSSEEAIFNDVLNEGSLFQYLLSRSSNISLEGLKWKYACLEAVFKQPWFANIPESTKKAIGDYLKLGVVFVRREAQVATETA